MARYFRHAAFAALIACVNTSAALAHPIGLAAGSFVRPILAPLGRLATPPRPATAHPLLSTAERLRAAAAGWLPVTAPPPFTSAGQALLLTNGDVLMHDNGSHWYTLTPDASGNYINGTWTQKASLPSGYAPLYFASAVLPDGRVIINGGEYNGSLKEVWTKKGAIYDPVKNTWTPVAPPAGWTSIGDAPSTVLSNGTYMLGNCCSSQSALYNEAQGTWTATGTGEQYNNEEGWTLLPSGELVVADVFDEPNSELYNPANGFWTSAGNLPAKLTGSAYGWEMGPQMLRQNGTVLVVGANGLSANYNPSAHAWTAGPKLPVLGGKQVDSADAPAVLLTNGDVLVVTSPGVFNAPSYFLDFKVNGTISVVGGPAFAPYDSSYQYKLLLLPTGQVLETDMSNSVEILTPGVATNTAIAPVITSVPTTLVRGNTYTAAGVRFNGVSQASTYGDDAQSATNYPLVAMKNAATGNVVFARTHGFSSMAVASPATVSTQFDVPSTIATGTATLFVIANGIQSKAVTVTIK